jgi:hypothetical protein
MLTVGVFLPWGAPANDVEIRKGKSVKASSQRQQVIVKYDANRDGVLSKPELKRLSKEEKRVLARTGGVGTAKKHKAAASEKKTPIEVQHMHQRQRIHTRAFVSTSGGWGYKQQHRSPQQRGGKGKSVKK